MLLFNEVINLGKPTFWAQAKFWKNSEKINFIAHLDKALNLLAVRFHTQKLFLGDMDDYNYQTM